MTIRGGEPFAFSSREQAGGIRIECKQPLFGRGMRLDDAVVKDMTDGKSAFGEAPRDQQAAMAVERIAFRTHQTDP